MNGLFIELSIGFAWILAAWTLPSRAFKWVTMLAALAFFACLDVRSAILLLAITLGGWGALQLPFRKGSIALVSGLAGLTILFSFKWLDGWFPLGISYFVFRQIGYQIEAYKNELPPHSLEDLLTYQFFPPVLLVGPIHRFAPFMTELRRRRWNPDLFSEGLEKIIIGLFHIAFVGNFLLSHKAPKWIDGLAVGTWHYLEALRFAFNSYFQFAGYSQVAVGLAAMAGLRVMDNFNRPFLAQNISEFWQRWHISLSSWCRDYVYLPLVASTRNVAIGLLLSLGLLAVWHEPSINYVLWGLMHVAATLVYRWWRESGGQRWLRSIHPSTRLLGHLLTFHFVVFSFTMIRTNYLAGFKKFWSPVIESLI